MYTGLRLGVCRNAGVYGIKRPRIAQTKVPVLNSILQNTFHTRVGTLSWVPFGVTEWGAWRLKTHTSGEIPDYVKY